MIAWLRSQPFDLRELDAKVAAALRAERLVRLNALKLLAARGKLHAALHWIHDFLLFGRTPGRVRPPSRDPARRGRALPGGAARARRGQPARPGRGSACVPGAGRRRPPADRVLDRGRRPGYHADALIERCVPRARLDARQARSGRGPLSPDRPAGRGQRQLPARGGHDRRDDRDAARAQARGDRRGHRRSARRTSAGWWTRSLPSCGASPTGTCGRSREPARVRRSWPQLECVHDRAPVFHRARFAFGELFFQGAERRASVRADELS